MFVLSVVKCNGRGEDYYGLALVTLEYVGKFGYGKIL